MIPRPDDQDDLAACPWAYPGTAAHCSGLLEGGRFLPLPAAELLDMGQSRTAVVAVGSNASPAVMHRKLQRHGITGDVPLLAGTLTGCAVGHSAHVSIPGFVAAAPYERAEAVTPVYVTLLDDAQLRCVDLTEPNYVRRRLRRHVGVLELEGGHQPASFDLYDSRWGVLAPPGEAVVPFGTQEALHTLLRAQWPPYRDLVGDGGASPETDEESAALRVMRLLAADAELRERTREAFSTSGWSRDSGLGHWPGV